MRLFVVLATFACSLRTSGGQGFPGLFDMDFGFAPQLPVSLPDVTNSTRWADVTEAMLEEVAFHCGWVRFCNSTGWKELYERRACSPCHECSCDDACYERGDCCVDKALNDVRDDLVLQTTPPAQPRYGCHSMFYTDFGDPTYALMIDKCPEGHSYENGLVEKCENASLSGLEGHWPVVSIQTKSVYRSIHCAKCNEDAASVLKWDVKIQCLDHVHLDDTSSQKAVLDKVLNVSGCHVSFDPPQGFQLHACQSVSDEAIISTCNATGERHLYDELMWKACETFHSYVKGFRVSFQNIFCALCNYEVADLSSVCPRQFPFPFVVVMSADALSRVTSSGTDQCTCQEGELYDVYERKCQKLHCSMTRQLVGEECSPLFGNSTGLAYDVTVRLTPSDVSNPITLDSTSSLEQVARNIRTSFLLGASSDSGWDIQMDVVRVIAQAQGLSGSTTEDMLKSPPAGSGDAIHVTNFLVRLKFATRWTEPLQELEKRLLGIIHTHWNVTIGSLGKKSFLATPFYIKPHPNDTQLYESVTLYSSTEHLTEYVVDITNTPSLWKANINVENYLPVKGTLSCPKVLLRFENETDVAGEDRIVEWDEQTGTVYHRLSGRNVSFEYAEVVEGRGVYVCAEKLYETMDVDILPLTAEELFPPALVYVSFACLTLSAVCLLLALLTFCLFSSLQTLPGKNTMGLIATLLITTLLFEFGSGRVEERQSCVVVGVLIHFFLVSSFTWMVICTVHMHRIFSNVIASRVDDREGSARVFLIHVIVSVVVPGLVVLSTLLANYYTSDHECVMDLGYGDGICYLSNRLSLILGSILPISLAVVINLVLFALTLHALRKLSRERRDVTQRNHEQFSIYVKLSTLTGINWLVGLVAALVDSEAVWYAFLVLCGLQGVYVFVAFVCNKRVLRLYRGLMCTCCGRGKQSTSSEQRGHGNGWAHSSSDQGLCPGSENTKSSSLMQHTTSENATGKSKAMSNTRL